MSSSPYIVAPHSDTAHHQALPIASELISPSDPRWINALPHIEHDIYDLPQYAEICALHENAHPCAFYAADHGRLCLIPLLVRPMPAELAVPDHWTDAVSPYGYSSALFHGDVHWIARALAAFGATCRDNYIVSVFLRLNPLIPIAPEIRTMLGVQVKHGSTIAIDLGLSEEGLDRQMRSGHRYDVARLRHRNFTARVDDWSTYDGFIALYDKTMERLHANGYYRFGPDYFTRLKSALGSHLHLVSVCAPDGELSAASLFTERNGIVQYHLAGSAAAFASLAPSKLVVHAAIHWAKAAGNRVLHLGGGIGGREDALFRYKSGFSKNILPFETWRIITDADKYSELVSDPAPAADFFPEYRASSLNGV